MGKRNFYFIFITIEMEDEYETPEDFFIFSDIGEWRTIMKDNGAYEKVFVPGPDIQKTLRSVLRYLIY